MGTLLHLLLSERASQDFREEVVKYLGQESGDFDAAVKTAAADEKTRSSSSS